MSDSLRPRGLAHQASLSLTVSRCLLGFMSIESVMLTLPYPSADLGLHSVSHLGSLPSVWLSLNPSLKLSKHHPFHPSRVMCSPEFFQGLRSVASGGPAWGSHEPRIRWLYFMFAHLCFFNIYCRIPITTKLGTQQKGRWRPRRVNWLTRSLLLRISVCFDVYWSQKVITGFYLSEITQSWKCVKTFP